MANLMGKRYICDVCKVEVVVTKAGTGTMQCHGQPMALK